MILTLGLLYLLLSTTLSAAAAAAAAAGCCRDVIVQVSTNYLYLHTVCRGHSPAACTY